MHRGRHNYPTRLKDLLRQDPSDIVIWIHDLANDSKDTHANVLNKVMTSLIANDMNYTRTRTPRPSKALGEASTKHTVWSMTHQETGAVFYFAERIGVLVSGKINSRLITFNGYVMANLPHANRAMYYFFIRMHEMHMVPSPEHFAVRDLEYEFETSEEAEIQVTRLSRFDLHQNIVVLNKVSGVDALYYRNTVLRMPTLSMQEYLG